jgi:HAD superfamily hydrolase (TIGR01509 family)
MRPRPEAQLTFRCLHEQGKRILLLTNYQSRAFRIALECFSFLRQADGWLVSADVHMLKPDPAIFRETIRRFDLNPARTLFLDDSVPNVETALYLGFQALVVRHEGDLTRFFLSD